ncbi:hypothetical protein CPT03_13775 [Pedobacter ginsengisoli]|uniref:Uncharacterized protein n=1 Tax=Pedobacter ginsengisoli TaxID=363852 RepID=A0A2D1U780_9SPHI|nr:hypothetical protein [Pedobacter ginsengisoli]ATP57465.1 hypothetical protein CPT03_13775 [Pedobacter ginsengisoli]
MEHQKTFLALNREDKFRFLYLSVKENEHFILTWIEENYSGDLNIKEESDESVRNAFDFLEKLIRPGIRTELILDKELMLNGMADDLLVFTLEVREMTQSKGYKRASMALTAIEALYTCIIDCFFSPVEYDEDACSFHVILMSALGNYLHADFKEINPEAIYKMSWADLDRPDKEYQSLKTVVTEFMDSLFRRI